MTINEIAVQKLDLKSGEMLVVKLTGMEDVLTQENLDSLKKIFQDKFPDNKILLMSMPDGGNVDLTIVKSSGDNVNNYCTDCSCGKKETQNQLEKGE